MNIIINHSSMVPIYEQIVDAVKTQIRKGELKEDENLPSVRMLAKDLKISAFFTVNALTLSSFAKVLTEGSISSCFSSQLKILFLICVQICS